MKSGNRSIMLLLGFCCCYSLYPQEGISSIESEIRKAGLEHREKKNFLKANTYFLAKNWDSTLVYAMKQLAVEKDQEVIDYCHYFRGYSFKNKKLLQEAIREFEMVSPGFRFSYKTKLYIGEIWLMEGDFRNALHNFKQAEKLSGSKNYDFKRGVLYHNIGLCYMYLDDFESAKKHLDRGFAILQQEKDTVSLIGAYMNIGNLYYEQYKDDLAIPYFEQAYKLSKNIKNLEIKHNAVLNMAIVAENKKDLAAALSYRKEYEKWSDSLYDQNKVWDIAQLEKQLMEKQKEKEIDVLEAVNKAKIAERNGLFFTSLLLLVLFGAGIYFYRQQVSSNRIILSQKTKLDELNTSKDQLFSIVSHDLRSSVNALKTSNTKLLDNLESRNYSELDKLLHNNIAIAHGSYNLLDNLLHWALLQTRQLYFHKESLHLLSIVQHIAFNYKPLMLDKNISFEIRVDPSAFVEADQSSLKIILRNLMDNAIKFTNENGTISIYTIETEPGFWDLIVSDSGAGMNKEKCEELMSDSTLLSKKGNNEKIGTGLGMQLSKSMVRKNDGRLLIESRENIGTTITIQLQKTKGNA